MWIQLLKSKSGKYATEAVLNMDCNKLTIISSGADKP